MLASLIFNPAVKVALIGLGLVLWFSFVSPYIDPLIIMGQYFLNFFVYPNISESNANYILSLIITISSLKVFLWIFADRAHQDLNNLNSSFTQTDV